MATSSVDLTGNRYSRLVCIGPTDRRERGSVIWKWKCDCGVIVECGSLHIKRGGKKSCGCLKQESKPNLLHGHCSIKSADSGDATRTYRSWLQMKSRCLGREKVGLKHYKDRGIEVCERWIDNFENFLSDMGERPNGTSLERIDNSKGYFPENCRWATQGEQLRNTRRTIRVNINGKELCLKDACLILNHEYDKVRSRMRKGMSAEKALEITS